MRQPGLYKTSLYSRGKDGMIKNFELQILICFNSSITKHWTPPYMKHPYLPHSFTKLSNFCTIGNFRWRTTNVLWDSEADEQFVRIQSPLNRSLVHLPIMTAFHHPDLPSKYEFDCKQILSWLTIWAFLQVSKKDCLKRVANSSVISKRQFNHTNGGWEYA